MKPAWPPSSSNAGTTSFRPPRKRQREVDWDDSGEARRRTTGVVKSYRDSKRVIDNPDERRESSVWRIREPVTNTTEIDMATRLGPDHTC
jgi:hypothetical protein